MVVTGFVILLASIYLVRARAQARQRRAQSWEQLVARLEPGWNTRQLGECLSTPDEAPAQRWERLRGARGLYVMFQNASVMLEMADYAVRNGGAGDRKLLAELRSDALQIRVSVVLALSQYALHQINERMCANAVRAAFMYKEMSDRMSDLLRVNGVSTPQFAGAF